MTENESLSTSVEDVQCMHHDFVPVHGVSTSVLTFGHWLQEPLPQNETRLLIILIPGNPGIIEYYSEFMKALYKNLHCTVPIWGVSHAGHVSSPHSASMPKLHGNENLYTLEGQILHKMAFMNTYVPSNRRILLIGHSIGCFIALELLKRLHHFDIVHSFLLFPTIERLSSTPNGFWVSPLLTYLRLPALLLIYALGCLSQSMKSSLLKWYFKSRPVPECVMNASLNLFQFECAKSCLFMANNELTTVTALDVDNIRQNKNRITFYYGSKDGWCPISFCYDLQKIFPEGDIRICEHNFEHAFVLENSQEASVVVAKFIVEEMGGVKKNAEIA